MERRETVEKAGHEHAHAKLWQFCAGRQGGTVVVANDNRIFFLTTLIRVST